MKAYHQYIFTVKPYHFHSCDSLWSECIFMIVYGQY